MGKKFLFFDLDDTLIITNKVFEETNERTSTLLYQFFKKTGVSYEEIASKFNEIDLANAKIHGLAPERYLGSWAETYTYFAQKYRLPLNPVDLEQVREKASEVFTTKLKTYPKVHHVLKTIKEQGHEMNILTAGDTVVQNQRLKDANLSAFFENVYVVPYKDPDVLKRVIGERDREKCVMIGNSLRSDIYPAISNGITSIHIPQETWGYDNHDVSTDTPIYKMINSITDLPKMLKLKNEELAF